MTVMPLLIAFLVLTVGTYLVIGVLDPRRGQVVARLAAISQAGVVSHEAELARPLVQRVFGPVLRATARWGMLLTPGGQRARMVAKLQQAGHHHANALHMLLAAKALGVMGSLVGAWLLGIENPPIAVIACGLGLAVSLIAPELVVNRMVADRQTMIIKSLPDTLDLITASVEAGLTMDGAIARIVSRPNREQLALAEELGRYLQEIRLGRSRAESLSELGRRCGVADLQSVVAALLQADSLGVGVATVLRAQSLHLRTRRKQRAQEAAMKAPVKMLFPLVLFIFPSIFIVTLGPAFIKLMDMFATHH